MTIVGGPVRFDVDLDEFQKWSVNAITRQIPFATALALTKLAVFSRDKVREDLPSHFKIRSRWTAGGIRVTPAKKGDWPHSFAVVGSRDEWMVLQETGGTKKPTKAPMLAIPTKKQTWRRSASGRMPKAQRPAALIKAGKAFEADDGRELLSKDPPYKALYWLRPRGEIVPRFEFRETVDAKVAVQYAAVFRLALERALKTQKKA